MDKTVDKVVEFKKLRDVWNGSYRPFFRGLTAVLGYSNDYISSLGGAMGFCDKKPVFVFLVNDGKNCKQGTGLLPKLKNRRKYCRLVFFEKSRLFQRGYDKDISKRLKSFLRKKGFYGVYILQGDNQETALLLKDIGFKRITVAKF